MNIFNEERSNYYKAKKRELTRQSDELKVIAEDALFVHYYGMSAYLELFPEAKDFGISWHRSLLVELQKLDKKRLANQLSGTSMAYAATQSKKASRGFKRIIKDLLKK